MGFENGIVLKKNHAQFARTPADCHCSLFPSLKMQHHLFPTMSWLIIFLIIIFVNAPSSAFANDDERYLSCTTHLIVEILKVSTILSGDPSCMITVAIQGSSLITVDKIRRSQSCYCLIVIHWNSPESYEVWAMKNMTNMIADHI